MDRGNLGCRSLRSPEGALDNRVYDALVAHKARSTMSRAVHSHSRKVRRSAGTWDSRYCHTLEQAVRRRRLPVAISARFQWV